MSKQSTNFVFTLNNYTEDELANLRKEPPTDAIQWVGFEEEVGNEGTPHLQGAVVFKKKRTITGGKKEPVFKRAHLEVMKGRIEHSEIYCNKEGKFESYGVRPLSSKDKGDNNAVRCRRAIELAEEANWEELKEYAPDLYLTNYNKLRSIARDAMVPPTVVDVLENEWIWGPTGSGKTRGVWERFPDAYIKKADTHWWCGYQGQETVIIDDFDKYFVKQGYHLKIWADHRPFLAETKGGAMMIRPKRIIVTSNYRIRDIWTDETTLNPLLRRFKEIEKPLEVPITVDGVDTTVNIFAGVASNLYKKI